MRKLFLIPLVCSLLVAGCGEGRKVPQAVQPADTSGQPATADEAFATPSAKANEPLSFSSDKSPGPPAESEDGIIPAEIDIPDIGVDANVTPLGLTKDRAMDVPNNEDDAGWFKPGYRPGVAGHAVIAGHVDSKTGPAVFYKLKKLKKGSKIIVRSKEGQEKVFRVVGLKAYPYDDAPLKEIFGPSDKPLLNLITCTGLYSKSAGTHQQRLVVTAAMVA